MSKFENEWYNKGYEDGFSDAINNFNVNDILEQIEILSDNERQQIIEAIKNTNN